MWKTSKIRGCQHPFAGVSYLERPKKIYNFHSAVQSIHAVLVNEDVTIEIVSDSIVT